jgi:hypothetical protein
MTAFQPDANRPGSMQQQTRPSTMQPALCICGTYVGHCVSVGPWQ